MCLFRRLRKHHLCHGQCINSHITKRTTRMTDTAFPRLPVTDIRFNVKSRLHCKWLSNLTFCDPTSCLSHRRKTSGPHTFHKKNIFFSCFCKYCIKLSAIINHRLFRKNRNACLQHCHNITEMAVIWNCNIYNVWSRIPKHLCQLCIDRITTISLRKCLSIFLASGNHRHKFCCSRLLHALCKFISNISGSHNCPSCLFHTVTSFPFYIHSCLSIYHYHQRYLESQEKNPSFLYIQYIYTL